MDTPTRAISKAKFFEKIDYTPHSKQYAFHNSTTRFRVPVAGRRFGKTAMVARDIEPTLMTPNKRIWICAPTYELGEKEFRVIWQDMIVKLQLGKEKKIKKAFNKRSGDMYIEFPWGTRIEVRSAERPETLVGEGLDHVIMSEAAKHTKETWDRYVRPALADRRGTADFGTTPESFNWLYDLWLLGRNPLFEEYQSWRMPAWENPVVYPGGRNDPEILLLERTMPYEWFQQEIAADFSTFVGKIFNEWDDTIHVQPCTYNHNWKNYIAFDWGFVNPMAAVEFQVDPMDRIHVWRLHYKSHMRLEDFLYELRQRPQPQGYKIDLCFGDAADPEAVATVCAKFRPCIADPRSKENWREGIDLVKSFLKTHSTTTIDEYGTPDDKPWLLVDPGCTDMIREFNNYRTATATSGKVQRNPREDAQKFDDHALDALRYGLMHIFKLGCTMSLASVVDGRELTQLPATGYFTSNITFA